MSYHLCARQIGQCVGLGRGIQEYHLCARNANCKKLDRDKVEKVVKKIKESKAKKIIKKAVEGVKSKGNRKQVLKAIKDSNGKTKYVSFD